MKRKDYCANFHSWHDYCEEFHKIIEEKDLPLFLRLESTSAFSFDCFFELRWSCTFRMPMLYHSTFGSHQIDCIEIAHYQKEKRHDPQTDPELIPLCAFLNRQRFDEHIFQYVKDAFEEVEGVDYIGKSTYVDGNTVELYSYFGKGAHFQYQSLLPLQYKKQTEAIARIAEYLTLTDRCDLQPWWYKES